MAENKNRSGRFAFRRHAAAGGFAPLPVILMVSVVAVLIHGHLPGARVPLDSVLFPLVGVILAIFLAIRNNAAHARHLEAQQVWGRILLAARVLTAQAGKQLPADGDGFERKLFVQRLTAFLYALTHQLRETDPSADLARHLSPEECEELRGMQYIPGALLDRLRLMLARAGRKRGDREPLLRLLDGQVGELAAAVAGCERISPARAPFAHGLLPRRAVYLYCVVLPFGLAADLGMATPLVCGFAACALFALEAAGRKIAAASGADSRHLALNALIRTIEPLHEDNQPCLPAP